MPIYDLKPLATSKKYETCQSIIANCSPSNRTGGRSYWAGGLCSRSRKQRSFVIFLSTHSWLWSLAQLSLGVSVWGSSPQGTYWRGLPPAGPRPSWSRRPRLSPRHKPSDSPPRKRLDQTRHQWDEETRCGTLTSVTSWTGRRRMYKCRSLCPEYLCLKNPFKV